MNREVTRKEKIELIERERDAWQCDADDHKKRGCMAHYEHEQAMADALTDALAALETCTAEPPKSARLDESGLMPCGCGGKAKQEDFFDGFFYFGAIKCPGCEIEIRIPSLTPEESSDRVKVAWNRAMGYKGGAE